MLSRTLSITDQDLHSSVSLARYGIMLYENNHVWIWSFSTRFLHPSKPVRVSSPGRTLKCKKSNGVTKSILFKFRCLVILAWPSLGLRSKVDYFQCFWAYLPAWLPGWILNCLLAIILKSPFQDIRVTLVALLHVSSSVPLTIGFEHSAGHIRMSPQSVPFDYLKCSAVFFSPQLIDPQEWQQSKLFPYHRTKRKKYTQYNSFAPTLKSRKLYFLISKTRLCCGYCDYWFHNLL